MHPFFKTRTLFTVYCLLIHSSLLASPAATPVTIAFFNEPGCLECEQINKQVFPQLQERFPGQCLVEDRDLGVMSNYLELVQCQTRLGIVKNEPVYMLVADTTLLSGLREIETGLFDCIALSLASNLPHASLSPPAIPNSKSKIQNSSSLLAQRFRVFTFPTVMLAGFLDGINPCAISTLVFFMSILSLSRLQGRPLWRLGLWYCFASFVTYFALGFGLLNVLRKLYGFSLARNFIETLVIVLLAIFAVLSFHDAWRYRQSGNQANLLLRLPAGIQSGIHALLKKASGPRSLILSAIGLGVAVTLLESVCTGQVYAPTLVLLIKSRVSVAAASAFLLAYNLMFILPLLAVFILTWRGLQWQRLLAWSRNNVMLSKCFLGLLFVVLAGLMIAL